VGPQDVGRGDSARGREVCGAEGEEGRAETGRASQTGLAAAVSRSREWGNGERVQMGSPKRERFAPAVEEDGSVGGTEEVGSDMLCTTRMP
jgi:hypothetical protein